MEEKEVSEKYKELIERYHISIEKLEAEQKKLSKNITDKDSIDFNNVMRVAGVESVFFKNSIISAIIVLEEGEIVEQEYFQDKIRFPYLSGFRAYRELPSMVAAFNKLDEKPDLVFISGHGILHPRGLGLASHFSLVAGVPTIGIAERLLIGVQENEDILLIGKKSGKILKIKQGANPIYVSPGNQISVETAAELVKRFVLEPHKLPEPLRLAKRYAKEIRKELFI